MAFRALHIVLWLLTAFSLTTQELAGLSVSPRITAECGKQVTLSCNVSSSQSDISIKHMEWFLNKSLCSVDGKGNMITHRRHALSDFHCEYKHGQLSLIFKSLQPLHTGNYGCKLRSIQGALHESTTVELQECSGNVEGVLKSDRLTCTFNHVYPDGDVHWFHGSRNLSDGSQHSTTKQMDGGGWMTITSTYLGWKDSDVPYNCSLRSAGSGGYIASTLVHPRPKAVGSTFQVGNGVGSQGPMRTFLCISILLAVALH